MNSSNSLKSMTSGILILNNQLLTTNIQQNIGLQQQQEPQKQQSSPQQSPFQLQGLLQQHDPLQELGLLKQQELLQQQDLLHLQDSSQEQGPLQQQEKLITLEKQINSRSGSLLSRTRLRELIKEVDPNEQLDEDVEDLMLDITDYLVENIIKESCIFSKHRKSNILEVKDVQMYLDRFANTCVPGYNTNDLKQYKRMPITEAHRQRMALIKKTASTRKY